MAITAAFIIHATVFAQSGDRVLNSPDGHLEIIFRTAGGQLVYEVSFQGKPLIEPSALRLDLKDQAPLGQNVRIVSAATSQADETYHLVAGKASTVRNHFNALRVELEENTGPGRKFAMEARAYDDAVAFRTWFPNSPH